MSELQLNKSSDIYAILADYSNDLATLKKRNGKLPAEAARQRIDALINEARVQELLSIQEYLGRHGHPRYAVMDDRIAALRQDKK